MIVSRETVALLTGPKLAPFWAEFERHYKSVMGDLRTTRDASHLRALDALDHVRGIPDRLARQVKSGSEGTEDQDD